MQTLTKPQKIWTDAALEALPKERGKFELIDGKLTRMSPANGNHGYIAIRIAAALQHFIAPGKLGLVYDSSTGFRLDPQNVLSPDVAYASRDWVLRSKTAPEEFFRGVPELAVEIISPSERKTKIRLKIEKYFARGTRLVWLVYPRREQVDVYTSPDALTTVTVGGLDGGAVLPGFHLPLATIFEDWF